MSDDHSQEPYDPFDEKYREAEFNVNDQEKNEVDNVFFAKAKAAAERIIQIAEHSTNENLALKACMYIVERTHPKEASEIGTDPLTARMQKMAERSNNKA